jgi:hypothetical protein
MSMTNREAVEILRAEQWAVLEDVEYGQEDRHEVGVLMVEAFKALHERGESAVLPGEGYADTLKRLMKEARVTWSYVERGQELIDFRSGYEGGK